MMRCGMIYYLNLFKFSHNYLENTKNLTLALDFMIS